MTHEQFLGTIRPKVHGSWNLHKYLPQDMDFFVLLSSSVGIAGSRGQGNYSAGKLRHLLYQQKKKITRETLTTSQATPSKMPSPTIGNTTTYTAFRST